MRAQTAPSPHKLAPTILAAVAQAASRGCHSKGSNAPNMSSSRGTLHKSARDRPKRSAATKA